MKPTPAILVTNDDGIQSPALRELELALAELGDVTVVAPDREMSATSQSLTLNQPLRYHEISQNRFAVEGTPTDCVILAAFRIMKTRPALVVSGVNRGPNIGDDVCYSGTVAAAFEGAGQGIPGIAVSTSFDDEPDFQSAARFAAIVAQRVLIDGLPPGVILNVNFPKVWNGGVRLTRQGRRAAKTVLVENTDPRGREYFWLHEELHNPAVRASDEALSDYEAVRSGFVSVTPLQIDRTAATYFEHFSRWLAAVER